MSDPRPFEIRKFQPGDRARVRELCCATGFLGNPIDPVFEDRELFADYLTAYYTDREPESCGFAQLEEPVSYNLADILAG